MSKGSGFAAAIFSRVCAVLLLLYFVGIDIALAESDEDPTERLARAYSELVKSDSRMRTQFMSAHSDLKNSRFLHRQARAAFAERCNGVMASDAPRALADRRLGELERENAQLRDREKELVQRRAELERSRNEIEIRANSEGRGEQYRREIWLWIGNYRDQYLNPFEREVLRSKILYARAVKELAGALTEISTKCTSTATASIATPAALSTIVDLIQKLQDVLTGQ